MENGSDRPIRFKPEIVVKPNAIGCSFFSGPARRDPSPLDKDRDSAQHEKIKERSAGRP
jgi:hypothetical protein